MHARGPASRQPARPRAARSRAARPAIAAPAFVALAVAAAWLVTACGAALPTAQPTERPAGTATPAIVAPASPSPSGPSRPFRPTPTPQPTFAVHVVEPGDTLLALADRYATTAESLAYWNRARYPSLDPDSTAYRPDRLQVGWELLVLPGAVVDPENLPPASDAPDDGGGDDGAVGPYPTLPPDGGAALVRRGPPGLDAVALTFDYPGGVGAGPGGAEAILQWLQVNGIPATVFVGAGADPAEPATASALARLARADAVAAGLLAPTDDAAGLGAELEVADAELSPPLGATTAPWLRPADGIASPAALRAAGEAGWTWAVAWDVDPGDDTAPAEGGPIATDIAARVVSQARGGSIVRLQLGGARTLEALPGILEGLEAAGLRTVTLEELLGLDGEG